jgi:hypothetical protein
MPRRAMPRLDVAHLPSALRPTVQKFQQLRIQRINFPARNRQFLFQDVIHDDESAFQESEDSNMRAPFLPVIRLIQTALHDISIGEHNLLQKSVFPILPVLYALSHPEPIDTAPLL